jgi:hypothetical protein
MNTDSDPDLSPRLSRLLRADATRVPAGLAARVSAASVVHLPSRRPAVVARLSWRWAAAAAALTLAAGISMRVGSTRPTEGVEGDTTIAVVIEAADESSLGQELHDLDTVRGVRLSDLDDEMRFLLADGRVDG